MTRDQLLEVTRTALQSAIAYMDRRNYGADPVILMEEIRVWVHLELEQAAPCLSEAKALGMPAMVKAITDQAAQSAGVKAARECSHPVRLAFAGRDQIDGISSEPLP